MVMDKEGRPGFAVAAVAELVRRHYGLEGTLKALPGERDQNFRLTTADERRFVVKISHPDEARDVLDMQVAVLEHLAGHADAKIFPRVQRGLDAAMEVNLERDGRSFLLRLVTYLEGRPIADCQPWSRKTLAMLGSCVGRMDRALSQFTHPAMHRSQQWDTKHAFRSIDGLVHAVDDPAKRSLVENKISSARQAIVAGLADLPMQVIHNDLNDYNVLVGDDGQIAGLIDFGDMVFSYRICDLAHSLAYLLLSRDDWGVVVDTVVRGFMAENALNTQELTLLPDFIQFRLCLSVCMAAKSRKADPENAYLSISEAPAWAALERFDQRRDSVEEALRPWTRNTRRRSKEEIRRARAFHLSPALSVAYAEPLKIVKGEGAYLFDESGERYLDCVNNVCHVGHAHPHVVAAGSRQMSILNTNTRYLHDNIIEFAERLAATMPEKLDVCFFVNSGSEANELALRLARTHTSAEDMIVVDHAYHGNTRATIDISPYKYAHQGGREKPDTTHSVAIPDRYRGPFGYDCPDAGERYAAEVEERLAFLAASGRPLAGFIAESILGVAGQIELPPGYLARVYSLIRAAGGVCIADEVQVGFGRVGTHMWAFETQNVVPDIVSLGKPIGNGHPLAAVVTTREIADSFHNGMEYFNTFGGNPVSCAIGNAVLDVIESQNLQQHAHDLGLKFKEGLLDLSQRYELIGDVRGRGLFLGFELVKDRESKEPATAEARRIVELMKARRILVTTEGPFDCMIKMKPPMVFSESNVDEFLAALDSSLQQLKKD